MNKAILQHLVCPDTLEPLTLAEPRVDGEEIERGQLTAGADHAYGIDAGIPSFVPADLLDTQTVRSFSQKWAKHKYYREHTRDFYTDWYLQRYGFLDESNLCEFLRDKRFVLDAGTGAGRDAANLAEHSSAEVFAVDTAVEALEVARREVDHSRVHFIHADINRLPFRDGFFDFISCDQVIHHTPDPRETFNYLTRKLKAQGRICCYVYRKKAAIREFTDDYVRDRISELPIDEALSTCEAITRLGRTLADLNQTIQIEEDIPVLGIRKGKVDLQRFFHFNVMKCFWNDRFDFFTNNIINFDWYHPRLCFRFEPDEFRAWFDRGFEIESFDVQEAGISCRARKVG